MSRTLTLPAAIVLCLLLAITATAQSRQRKNTPRSQTEPTPAPQASRAATAPLPDLEITANVTVRELKFEQVGDAKVEFTGQPTRDTVNDAERQSARAYSL